MVVEVRQPTLGGAGRGWGPAANTGLGWPWLRSGSQHLARMAVVEVRRQEEARRRRRRRRRRKEEAAALIKSNNPHLAGGEKTKKTYQNLEFSLFLASFLDFFKQNDDFLIIF